MQIRALQDGMGKRRALETQFGATNVCGGDGT